MNELQVSRRNFSPATKMLDQAPAPSPCVSPRPDTLLTHLVSRRARGGPRFVNATPSRRPWRTVSPPAIPPSDPAFRIFSDLGCGAQRTSSVTGGNNKVDAPQIPTTITRNSKSPTFIARRPESRTTTATGTSALPSASHTPRRVSDVGWGGGAALVPAAPLPPYRGPEIPPSLSSAVAPSGIAWPEGGGCPVGLGGGMRVDGPRPWPRGRLRGWGLGVRVGGEGWGW